MRIPKLRRSTSPASHLTIPLLLLVALHSVLCIQYSTIAQRETNTPPSPASAYLAERLIYAPSKLDIEPRRLSSLFSTLVLPKCALRCFIVSLADDGCKGEADFACHCRGSALLENARACLEGCGEEDRRGAFEKVTAVCRRTGFGGGGEENGDGDGNGGDGDRSGNGQEPQSSSLVQSSTASMVADRTSSTALSASSLPSRSASPITTTLISTSTTPSMLAETLPPPTSTSVLPPPPTSSSQTAVSQQPSSSSSTEPAIPTDTPLALLPPNRQLSPAAKAGISISVFILALALVAAIALYIRRLKRELAAAQSTAAGVSESAWGNHISIEASRRDSWRSTRRSGIGAGGDDWRGRSPPISPLSPRETRSVADDRSIAGILGKRNRRHVLSVVMERSERGDDDDDDCSSTANMVREPVPGQNEGLVDPLELDGEGTRIVELPVSVTPRARSRER